MSYFLNLRHLYQDGERFATAIPKADHVAVIKHMYQTVLTEDMELTYVEYRSFIKQHSFSEKTPQGVESSLPDLSVQNEENARQATLFDYI
ncbi:hypothetical protein GCM10022378_11420 [Salinicoccus jeotgali]|uniref:Uncharacterized protein n=1 Tax=Salinicoccus jeotgali TaxID=381634 RepID=A0ABP7ERY0_9STAP